MDATALVTQKVAVEVPEHDEPAAGPGLRIDPGLYIGVNSPRRTADFPTGLTGLMDELSSEWTGMLDYSLQIASMIMEEV